MSGHLRAATGPSMSGGEHELSGSVRVHGHEATLSPECRRYHALLSDKRRHEVPSPEERRRFELEGLA